MCILASFYLKKCIVLDVFLFAMAVVVSVRMAPHLLPSFGRLFVEKIKKHPGYAKVSPADKARVKKLLKSAFDGAMELKDKLKEKYDEEKKEYIKKQKETVSRLNMVDFFDN